MNVFRALKHAALIVGDEDSGRIYVWNGSAEVHIFDEDFDEVDMFSMSEGFDRKLTPRQVRAIIEAHRQEMLDDH